MVDPTVPETDPNRLVLAWCECCGVLLAKRASDRNRMHFDCWADHHCGPDSPWPPGHQTPTPDEIVRRSIELMITDVTLTEVGDTIRAEPSREKRAETEQEIRYAAQVYASQVTLDATGPSEQEIAEAIHGGIEQLGRIFGEAE